MESSNGPTGIFCCKVDVFYSDSEILLGIKAKPKKVGDYPTISSAEQSTLAVAGTLSYISCRALTQHTTSAQKTPKKRTQSVTPCSAYKYCRSFHVIERKEKQAERFEDNDLAMDVDDEGFMI